MATAASVTVGQAARVPGSITLTNANTGPDQGTTNVVCNAGDGGLCAGADQRGIEIVPACAIQDELTCATGNADPGVFRVSATARGQAGSACDGMNFTVAVSDPATGAVRFTPPAFEAVTLPEGSSCVIEYTLAVLRLPRMDAQPLEPGVQTRQVVGHRQITAFAAASGAGANLVTVLPATASLATTASGSVAVGGMLTDTATVTGLVNPAAGATMTFRLYGPRRSDLRRAAAAHEHQAGDADRDDRDGDVKPVHPDRVRGPSLDRDVRRRRQQPARRGRVRRRRRQRQVTAAGGGGEAASPPPPFPAKLEMSRACVDRAARRLTSSRRSPSGRPAAST